MGDGVLAPMVVTGITGLMRETCRFSKKPSNALQNPVSQWLAQLPLLMDTAQFLPL